MPATVNFQNPLVWAILVGWIISVILHEFAHGLVAHWGGDYTIRERGGLSLNPLQYVDPVFSILFPAVVLMLGGIPLPGGATYVRRDLLRGRLWDTAVSLAGPATNGLLFLACALPLHPAVGWIDPHSPNNWTTAQVFLAATAVLQLMAMILNLIPVPGLDGFHAIQPYLPHEWQEKLSSPAVANFAFFVYFMALWQGRLLYYVMVAVGATLHALGLNSTVFGLAWDEVFRS